MCEKQLSQEQQKEIENSLWVVNTALKKQGLQYDNDLRQSAILYMCKCILRFDPSMNIKWTTYAYKNILLFIKRTNKKENIRKMSIADDDLFDFEKNTYDTPYDVDESKIIVYKIKNHCNKEERTVLDLKMDGYTVEEISAIMNCSASKINKKMQLIKSKAKEIVSEF